MKLCVRKDIFDSVCDSLGIEKAYKYIRKYKDANGEWRYVYPSNQPGISSNRKAIKNIALETPIISGQILDEVTEENVDAEIARLQEQKLICPALGNREILVNEKTKEHGYETKGEDRSVEATRHKLRYLPFVPEILKNGKLLYKSYRREYEYDKETGVKGKYLPHKNVTYGILCRIKYFDKDKNKNVIEPVELVIAYDEEKKNYVLSFTDYNINVNVS